MLRLADSLSYLVETKGAGDALVQQILAGKSPRQRAAELITGTQLADVAYRKQLAAGGQSAIAASTDPMIRLAVLVDPTARSIRKTLEQQIEEPQRQAYAKIAAARFATTGTNTYPDATFTLRLAFGKVAGYEEDGKAIPPWTTIEGAFARAADHHNAYPFNLPQRWLDRKADLDLKTPFNFVSTADIIGGNSGSPTVNRAGDFVGIIFDGNLESLVLDYAYTDVQARPSPSTPAPSSTHCEKCIRPTPSPTKSNPEKRDNDSPTRIMGYQPMSSSVFSYPAASPASPPPRTAAESP